MKNVAINFKLNLLVLFLIFSLMIVVTTFGQTASEELPEIVIDPTPQSYGDLFLVEVDLHFDDANKLGITVKNESHLGDVVFVARKGGVKDVSFADLPEVAGSDEQIEYDLDATADVNEIFLKTEYGVSSLILIKEGDIYYALDNGKLAGTFVDGNFSDSLNGKPADYFKNKVAWQYTPDVEN